MKRHAIWLMSVLCLSCTPEIAAAQGNGFYLGLGSGAIQPLDSDISSTDISTSANLGTGWAGVGAIGYRLADGLRTEVELGYRSTNVDSLAGSSVGMGEVNVSSVMSNVVYEIRRGSVLTPYLGVGIGLASIDFEDVQPVGGSVLHGGDTVLAYQGIVGLGYLVSERVQLFADYRFFATADAGLSTRSNVGVDSGYADHTLLVGLRFSFAAPKPAMKAEPAQQLAAPTPPPATPKTTPTPAPPVPEIPRTYLVFFYWDKADLTPEALVTVQEVATNVDHIAVTRIRLTGHTDRSGLDSYNIGLSRRRAEAVRSELIRLGVPPQDIAILWKGEQEPLVITGDGVREPQNRRVEIILE